MNMVKALVAAVVLVGSVSVSQAAGKKTLGDGNFGPAGCGLGYVIFGNGNGPIALATSYFNSAFSQSSAISSGTSGCRTAADYADTKTFIDNNATAIENDVVRGQGEALETLSKIMKCDGSVLSVTLKNNYKEIYSSKETSTQKVMETAAKVCAVNG